MRAIVVAGIALLVFMTACSRRDEDRAKEQMESARRKTAAAVDKTADKAKELKDEAAQKLDQSVAAAQAGTDQATGKLQQGADDLKTAGTQASAKLDRAATITRAKAKLLGVLGVKSATAISVDASEHTVTLSGKVATLKEKLAAEDAVLGVSGVTKVDNNLSIEP